LVAGSLAEFGPAPTVLHDQRRRRDDWQRHQEQTSLNTFMSRSVNIMKTQIIDPKDCIVLFADLQQGIIELARTIPPEQLRKGVRGLAKLAKIFDIPVIVSSVAGEDGKPAVITPEIEEGYGKYSIHHRSTANSLLSEEILTIIRNSGRHTLLISGVATELAVQLPATTAAEHGYRAFVVVDACGGISERTEQAALARIAHAGATTTCVMTLAGELAGDFRQATSQAAIGVVFDMAAG
jgi:nicotinamidase-related amidase